MMIKPTFSAMRTAIESEFIDRSYEVKAPRWQGIDISTKPEMAMREVLNYSFQVPLRGIEDLDHWRDDIKPNLPFADVHFAERVGGIPTNPGEAWKIWPWGHKADAHRTEGGQFTHTYQERFWPKFAGQRHEVDSGELLGIRYAYADLNDAVDHLTKDPLSRQCYIPIWFPEDGTCNGRRPCTLGYHFINRHGYLHVAYYIRSCDFIRHWADDCYLTTRLLLWLLARIRERDNRWEEVIPGLYTMHIVSFHMFVNDWRALKVKYETPTQRFPKDRY